MVPELHSKRLHLRELRIEDASSYFNLMSNHSAVKYYGREPMQDISTIESEFIDIREKIRSNKLIRWAVIETDTNSYIGHVGIKDFNNNHKRGTLSCIISPNQWGKGYGRESLTLVIKYCWDSLRLNRLQVFVDPRNTRAVRMFLHLGFKIEALLKEYEYEYDMYVDLLIMSIIKE